MGKDMGEEKTIQESRKGYLRYLSGSVYLVTAILVMSYLVTTFANYLIR